MADNPEKLDNIIKRIFDSGDARQAALQSDNPVYRTVARLSDKAAQPQLTSTAKAQMLQQVLDSMPTAIIPKTKPESNVLHPSFWSGLAKIAAGFVVAMLVAGLVAVPASADSLPGDALYPVKRQVEAVQVAIAFAPEARAEIHLNQAQTRLDEWQQLSNRNEYERQLLDDGLESINESVTIALGNDLYEIDLAFYDELNNTLNAYGEALTALEDSQVIVEDAIVDDWQENLDFIWRRIVDVGESRIPGDFGCGRPGNACNASGNGNGNANSNANGNANGRGTGNATGNATGGGNGRGNGNGRGRP
jgi:hypothetical protein